MTGEMGYIKQNGEDQDGEIWELHAKIAEAIGGELKPFDKYQGPYIAVGGDLRTAGGAYAMPVKHLGIVRLWVIADEKYPDNMARVYREDNKRVSNPFYWTDYGEACLEAKKLLEI